MEEKVKNAQNVVTDDREKIKERPENDFLRIASTLAETNLFPLIEGTKKGFILIAHDPDTTDDEGRTAGGTIIASVGKASSLVAGMCEFVKGKETFDIARMAIAKVRTEIFLEETTNCFDELNGKNNQPETEQGKEG